MATNIHTVIEITDTHIKLLQAKVVSGKVQINRLELCSIEGKLDEDIENELSRLLGDKALASEGIVYVLPRRLVTVRRMRLPSHDEQEIRKMLPLHLGSLIPYAMEDIVHGFQMLERDQEGYSNLIVYVVHKDVCEKCSKVFDRALTAPSRYVLSSLGVLEWWCSTPGGRAKDAVMILNMDLLHSEVCFVARGELLFSRVLNWGVLNCHEDHYVGLKDQLALSLKLYTKERYGGQIAKLIIVSFLKKPSDSTMASTLEQDLGLPLEIHYPLEQISLEAGVRTKIEESPGLSLTVCLGMVLADPRKLINLVSKKVEDVKKASIRKHQVFRFACSLVLFFIVLIAINSVELVNNSHALRVLEQDVKKVHAQAKAAGQAISRVESIDDYLAGRVSFSFIILKLYQIIPPEISLRSLTIDQGGNMIIGGYAQSGASVNLFQSRLVSATEFSDVTLQFTAKRKLFNQDLVEFKIQFKVKGRK